MHLVADEKIPHLDLFTPYCDSILCVPGTDISASTLLNADILLTRTVTKVSAGLLKDNNLQFIGSASAGIDHIDLDYLKHHHIPFHHAPGANAHAVADYVTCTIAILIHNQRIETKRPTIGIIGCGNVGHLLATRLKQLGFLVLCHDPFIQKKQHILTSLNTLLKQSDIITLHTPLTQGTQYPTAHMINTDTLSRIKARAILINTARGGIVDELALAKRDDILYCCDVWENEPYLNHATLKAATIATPHIAGYSQLAKRRATEMVFNAAAKLFDWPVLAAKNNGANIPTTANHSWLKQAIKVFNPLSLSQSFKKAMTHASNEQNTKAIFLQQRNSYALREELNL